MTRGQLEDGDAGGERVGGERVPQVVGVVGVSDAFEEGRLSRCHSPPGPVAPNVVERSACDSTRSDPTCDVTGIEIHGRRRIRYVT